MASFFSGWIGYGTALQAGVLQEPVDSAYVRRPITFSQLDNGRTYDVGSGTVGPSTVPWGVLTYAGLFDSQSSGNLLLVFPLNLPVTIGIGATYTTGTGGNVITGINHSTATRVLALPSGTSFGQTPDGRVVMTNLPVQVVSGTLAAQTSSFGTSVSMASLPSQAPASGSGQLWNNGGIISVA